MKSKESRIININITANIEAVAYIAPNLTNIEPSLISTRSEVSASNTKKYSEQAETAVPDAGKFAKEEYKYEVSTIGRQSSI